MAYRMAYRYVPLIRSKAGEADALINLMTHVKQRLYPLIHLAEATADRFTKRTSRAWAGRSMALDGAFNFGHTNSATDFLTLFDALGAAGILIIPSVEYDAPPPYIAAAAGRIGRYAPGLVIKSKLRHLAVVENWAAGHGWNKADIDLVITAGHIPEYDPEQFTDFVAAAITQGLQGADAWRSVTLASSAAPKDVSNLTHGRNLVPRLDWHLWQSLYQQVGFRLDYGDYGIGHPDLTEPPGVAMAGATASVRYTIDDHWVVLKGRRTGGPTGQAMGVQYRHHALALTREGQFNGLKNCWADDQIVRIAKHQAPGAGNRTTWVSIGVNRHLCLVSDRLP